MNFKKIPLSLEYSSFKSIKILRCFKNLEQKLFILGIFFLPSAPFISSLLFIYPLFKGLIKKSETLFKDKESYPLIIASLIMIIKCILDIYYPPIIDESWDVSLSWLGLVNWIPLFLCYFGFQPYLATLEKRLLVSRVFIASTVPIIFSGISQYFLKIYGPFKILNGLIIWFQRPIDFENGSGLTSVFSNPNITGTWLTLIWPFCIASLLINKKNKSKFDFYLMILLCIAFVVCAVLTNSRGAWLNLIIPIPIILGRVSLIWLVPILFLTITSILLTFMPIVNSEVQAFFRVIVPKKIWVKFSEIILDFSNFPRIEIWRSTINLISRRPFWGWGAASFPILFYFSTGLSNNHSHNLFLELSLSYGLFVSTLVFATIAYIMYFSFQRISKNKHYVEIINNKAWWAAAFIFLTSHLYDISYFDLRISIASWIFLAGLRSI